MLGAQVHRGLIAGAILVACLGLLASGMSTSGFYMQEVYLDFENGGFEDFVFDTEFGIEASFGGWTTGLFIDFESDGWEDLEIFTAGTLGAVDIFSWFEFYAVNGDHLMPGEIIQDWDTVIQLELSGVELWGVFSMLSAESGGVQDSGTGLAWGLHEQIGAVGIWAEMTFNLESFVQWVVWNGMDTVLGSIQACDLVTVIDPTCAMSFAATEVFVTFPFACVDVGAFFGIAHDGDFAFSLWAEHIQTGLDWLVIDLVELWYFADEKLIDFTFDVSLGEALCITPFVALEESFLFAIDAITLEGLQMVCPVGDATAIASVVMDSSDFYIGKDARIHPWDGGVSVGPVLASDCVGRPVGGADFAIGIETGGDGCCAPFQIGLYAYFDSSAPTPLFDLQRIRFVYRDNIGERLTWSLVALADHNEFEGIEIIVNYEWGHVQLVNSEESCCSYVP